MRKRIQEFKYLTGARWWTRELATMFVLGLLLASALWLGLWFLHLNPVHAAELQAEKVALESCVPESKSCNRVKDKLEAENKEISRQLEEARVGWGRCIRSQNAPED